MKKKHFMARYERDIAPKITAPDSVKANLKQLIAKALSKEINDKTADSNYAALGVAISDMGLEFVAVERLMLHLRDLILEIAPPSSGLEVIKAFQANKRLALLRDEEEIAATVEQTQRFESKDTGALHDQVGLVVARPSASAKTHPTFCFKVLKQDTLLAAQNAHDAGSKPFVLSLADQFSIGGGIEIGAMAQEEMIFMRTNLFLSLYPHGHYAPKDFRPENHRGRHHYNDNIPEFGSYYSAKVMVLSDGQGELTQPFEIAVGSVAGYDLGKPHDYEATLTRNGHRKVALLTNFREGTKRKIRHLLDVALHKGHEHLILGALSCGAFKLPDDRNNATAHIVAEAYRSVLTEPAYYGKFKTVDFAILSHGHDPNFDIFNRVLGPLTAAQHSSDERPFAMPETPIKNLLQASRPALGAAAAGFWGHGAGAARDSSEPVPTLTAADGFTPHRMSRSVSSANPAAAYPVEAEDKAAIFEDVFAELVAQKTFHDADTGADQSARFRAIFKLIENALGEELVKLTSEAYAFYLKQMLPRLVDIHNQAEIKKDVIDNILNLSPYCDQFTEIKVDPFQMAAKQAIQSYDLDAAREQHYASHGQAYRPLRQ